MAFAFTLPGALLAARVLCTGDATLERAVRTSTPLSMCGCVAGGR